MARKIEIFTMGGKDEGKVDCRNCPSKCSSKDQAHMSSEFLYNQLMAFYGSDDVEILLHDYSTGDQDAILARQNEVFKNNNVKRIVNKALIGPLAPRIWPSVVIDDVIKSEAVLLDLSRITALMKV